MDADSSSGAATIPICETYMRRSMGELSFYHGCIR